LYDVQGNSTESFYPYTETSQHKNVGGPVIVGVIPKAEWEGGNNINHFYNHPGKNKA